MAKGLTATIVFDAMSLNYGEGLGNISELKKLSKGGEYYSYLSRQAIRYDIYRMLVENTDFTSSEAVINKDAGTNQFSRECKIDNYPELDLFGYMKTGESKKKNKDASTEEKEDKNKGKTYTRSAVVRFSPAVSLEPFMNDIEFAANKNFADRAKADPDPFQLEHHQSLYSYTVTIDLDKMGKDTNENIDLDNKEKYNRVSKVLDILKVLNREIKGRVENLNPLFIIGGVYNIKNPFFLNRIKVEYDKSNNKYNIDTEVLESSVNLSFNNEKVKDQTGIGYVSGIWKNEDDFKKVVDSTSDIETFFETLKSSVKSYYKV